MRAIFGLAFVLSILSAPALAQSPPRPVEFADTPLRIESLGLTMQIPVGATRNTTRLGAVAASTTISDPAGAWVIRVQASESSNKNLTLEEVSDKVVADILSAFAQPGPDGTSMVDARVKVLLRDVRLELAGRRAARSYILTPPKDAATRGEALVFGHSIVGIAPGRFILFELITTEPRLNEARTLYETVVATVTLADPVAQESSRLAALAAGSRFIDSLTREDYEAVLGGSTPVERWQRLFVPAPTRTDADAKEIAYRRIRTWIGKRGELDPRRDRARWNTLESQEGYLVRIESRFLQDGVLYDSQAVFFMTPDRNEEAWSIQMAVREPGSRSKPALFAETGARSGRTMNIDSDTRGTSETIVPTVPDEGYITQVEHYILPQLLAHKGIAADFGFYVFQSASGDVRLRRDAISAADNTWRIVTQMTEDLPPQTSTYNRDASLIRIVLADGRLWEPIDSKRLLQLWKQKGLPLD